MDKLVQLLEYMRRNQLQTAILAALVTLTGLVATIQHQLHQQQLAAERVRAIDRALNRSALDSGDQAVQMFDSWMSNGKQREKK